MRHLCYVIVYRKCMLDVDKLFFFIAFIKLHTFNISTKNAVNVQLNIKIIKELKVSTVERKQSKFTFPSFQIHLNF